MPEPQFREQILELLAQGKTNKEISEILCCCTATVSYHTNHDRCKKEARERMQKHYAKQHPYKNKTKHFLRTKKTYRKKQQVRSSVKRLLYGRIRNFLYRDNTNQETTMSFTYEDAINKIGENPVCYLTGTPIDINQPSTYQFDHIIPVSRGGDNSLDNLGICITRANQAKRDMTPDEFLCLCQQVVNHNSKQNK